MTNLYEISETYRSLFNKMEFEDVWNDENLKVIEDLNDKFEDKAIAIGIYIQELQSSIAALADANIRIKARMDNLLNRREYLREFLKSSMEKVNKTIINSDLFDLKIKKNAASVHIIDETQIPIEFYILKTSQQLDKVLMKEKLKNNQIIPGAELLVKTRLEIK